MKYICLIIIILISGCTYKEKEKEDYNILDNNSIRFIKENNSTTFMINKDNEYYLLPLGDTSIDNIDYLIKINNTKYDIKYKEEYLLDKDIIINDIEFKINDKIEIIMNNNIFCIYMRELDKDNYSECDFIYLYNIDKDFNITLMDNLLILFYDTYTKFNYRFMYELSKVWIDSYTISNTSYTTLTLYEDNFNVTSYKIRGKTIHKK